MPLYDYQCRNCGHIVEVLHGVNDPGPQACTVCGGQMRKLMSQPAIVFKGSGWAKKDFRDSKSATKSTSKASSEGSASSSDGSTSSSESGSGKESSASSSASSKSTETADKPAAKESSSGAAAD